MRVQSAVTALALLVATVAAADEEERVSYDGYQVFRIDTHGESEQIHELIEGLRAVEVSCGESDHFELAVAPQDVEAFQALGLDASLLSEDLGIDLAEEGPVESFYDGMCHLVVLLFF